MVGNSFEKAYTPIRIRGLEVHNRFIKSATYEGMTEGGYPTLQLIEHHRRLAMGGVGLTTVAYGAVSPEGRTNRNQLLIGDRVASYARELTAAVHAQGGRCMLQLTHCGYFTKNQDLMFRRSLGPSVRINLYGILGGIILSRSMSKDDMRGMAKNFADAAVFAQREGFDAVEIHMGHGYLLSQFLSPRINRRKDGYGGSVANRLRFPLEVVAAVRQAVGEDYPIFCKINLEDGFRNGLTIKDSVEVAKALEKAGVDALVMSGGFTSITPFYLMRGDVPLWEMVKAEKDVAQKLAMLLFGRFIMRKFTFEENFFMPMALKIREAVTMPLAYIGGVCSKDGIERAMDAGFDMIALARAVIHDPDFLLKIRDGRVSVSECNHCNICVAEMDRGGVRCVL
ncbi:MAG: NADH:flavin oxidoreductase [Bacteroidales bacterium]|nr:NADH:flavin oxidoreductase [Lentimicrobiaceae bacterium]MDD5695899.1 NADH:flavin oxidoreductase [Bacteroidales bacterium]